MTYGSGQRFYIPQNPVNSNDISCQSCLCDRGYKSCRGKITCDFFFPCEKFIPAPPGTCCPTCGMLTVTFFHVIYLLIDWFIYYWSIHLFIHLFTNKKGYKFWCGSRAAWKENHEAYFKIILILRRSKHCLRSLGLSGNQLLRVK